VIMMLMPWLNGDAVMRRDDGANERLVGMDADKNIDVKQLVARHPLCVPVVLTRLVACSYKSKCHVLT
jgi:hypothetical protein